MGQNREPIRETGKFDFKIESRFKCVHSEAGSNRHKGIDMHGYNCWWLRDDNRKVM